MKIKEVKVKGYIGGTKDDYFKESFKGEIQDVVVKWPKELGVVHPFKFEDAEKVYKHYGLINGAINKIADNIVGEFTVDCENPNVQALVNDFMKNSNFTVKIREWIREGLIKGNGFLEIDLKEAKIRVINANNMYVRRNTKGEVLEYNQYLGDMSRFTPNSRKLITFKENQIAHLPINYISDEAYGWGIIMPNERLIENMIKNEQDLHKLISRKAGAPIHVKFGQPGEAVSKTSIDDMSSKLQYMTNRTEWVTDGNTEMKVIDFGQVGQNLTDCWLQDFRELIAGMDVPEVLLNSGQLNEGIAKVQLAGWQRKIRSYQDLIEDIINNKIIKPYLEENGMSGEEVDFIWNLPGEEEKNLKLTTLNTLLGNMSTTENMKRLIQIEIAKILNITDFDKYLPSPEEGLDEQNSADNRALKMGEVEVAVEKKEVEKKKEMDIKQPEIPKAKANTKAIGHTHIKESQDITLMEWVNVAEANVSYIDFLSTLIDKVNKDKFEDLSAIEQARIEQKTEEEMVNRGLLTETEVKRLKSILRSGFRRNQPLSQIVSDIKDGLNLRDRVYIKEDGSEGVLDKKYRPELIARTESVRLTNEALKTIYQDQGLKEWAWFATISDRTCEDCMGMQDKIVKIGETFTSDTGAMAKQPPLHDNCRCVAIGVK